MKLTWLSRSLIVVLISLAVFSCRKNSNEKLPGTPGPDIAGKGGNATLKITAKRDNFDIDSGKIYIKYNEHFMPANRVFDDSFAVTYIDDNPPVASFPGLKRGTYFLYAEGWDILQSRVVKGSAPYTIKTDTTATYNIILPVN